MNKEVEGIILLETKYKESSKILQILTKEYGVIGVIAKNALSIKSLLRVKTEKYIYGKFNIFYKEGKLSNLISVDVLNYFERLRSDIVLIGYLNYLCDLTYQVTKSYDGIELFGLLINALTKINDGLDEVVITNILELKYLDYLGVKINLDNCNKCHSSKNIVTLNIDAGGFICKNCYHNEYLVNPKTISMIRKYYYVDLSSITKLNISEEVKIEINLFITQYYDKYTGIYLKSKEFLNKIRM